MMYKADLNPIELLIWSRNRSLQEVQKKIYEIKSETSSSLKNDDNLFVATLTKDELSDANVQSHQKLTQKNVPDDIIKCPEKDCKFNVSLCEKTDIGSESLTTIEIIKSHMALKHCQKNYNVTREVLDKWFGSKK